METKKIEHALGIFTFEYDESKPWTEEDDLMLNRYIELMDIEDEINKKTFHILGLYDEHNKNIEALRATLAPIKDLMKAAQEATDEVLNNIAINKPRAFLDWADRVNKTTDAIATIDAPLNQLAKESDPIIHQFNELVLEQESGQRWERFEEIQKRHYGNCENNAIDISSFYNQDQKMRDTMSYHTNRNKDMITFCDKTILNYNYLMLEIDRIYCIWEEHGKRVRLIEFIVNERSGLSALFMN
jgi:hypothetical protein